LVKKIAQIGAFFEGKKRHFPFREPEPPGFMISPHFGGFEDSLE
jgi:hypothetical protein